MLVVTGDICEGDSDTALRVVARPANGKPAVFMLGNHEFWGREVGRERRTARRAAERRRVTLLDDGAADIAGLRFVGGTLWADGRLAGPDATPALPTNEFIRVGTRERLITGTHEARLHRRTRWVIEAAIGPGGTRIVCNPAGPGFTNPAFRDDWVVEV